MTPEKQEEKYEPLDKILFSLDWTKILSEAINARKTSWNENPVREWRNASDEVLTALLHALEDNKLVKEPFRELKTETEIRNETLDKVMAEIEEWENILNEYWKGRTEEFKKGYMNALSELKSALEKMKETG